LSYHPFYLGPSWQEVLQDELSQPYIAQLVAFVEQERLYNGPVYPPAELTFSAFRHTPYDKVKVVIIGQDPYHGSGQAHGLSFSVPKGVPPPPSLLNIYKELEVDLNIPRSTHGCLLSWADQGVLLLNATLTVKNGQARSHYGKGWERFTDAVVAKLGQHKAPIVFLLWGKSAQEKVAPILEVAETKRHLILTAAHPSPLSAHSGFFGCRHFSKANAFMQSHGLSPIDWTCN
jgi:uracil-DNA glycosylase